MSAPARPSTRSGRAVVGSVETNVLRPYGTTVIVAVPAAPPSTVAVIVTVVRVSTVPAVNVAVLTELSASVTRLKDPNGAPVSVFAEYVTSSRGVTIPTARVSVTRIDVLPVVVPGL